MTINELLSKIERLDKEATEEPWTAFGEALMVSVVMDKNHRLMKVIGDSGCGDRMGFNFNFIARSRTLLPLCASLLRVFVKHMPTMGREAIHDELAAALSQEGGRE